MQKIVSARYQTSFLRRYLMLAFLVVMGYLCQVCVIPYCSIASVAPNLLYVVIGIVTVAYGKLRAFWVAMIFGLLMEIMLPSVPFVNLAVYPLSTLFCSFAFADKPLKTLEYERATNQHKKELPAWLRTLLCTALNILVYEVVNVTYIYLGGNALRFHHFLKAFLSILYTSLLCFGLLFPIRRMIFGPKKQVLVLKSAPVTFQRG